MKKTKQENNKVTFGKRRCGKLRKRKGPKDKHIKPSVGQGR
jgi:hypothetical protein